ncbi:MAG: hypothetical protein AB7F22_03195 [Reyranella sp.]
MDKPMAGDVVTSSPRPTAAVSSPVVDTASGKVVGVTDRGVHIV